MNAADLVLVAEGKQIRNKNLATDGTSTTLKSAKRDCCFFEAIFSLSHFNNPRSRALLTLWVLVNNA